MQADPRKPDPQHHVEFEPRHHCANTGLAAGGSSHFSLGAVSVVWERAFPLMGSPFSRAGACRRGWQEQPLHHPFDFDCGHHQPGHHARHGREWDSLQASIKSISFQAIPTKTFYDGRGTKGPELLA